MESYAEHDMERIADFALRGGGKYLILDSRDLLICKMTYNPK